MAWGSLTIRFRLGAALAIALLPVLMLGAAQSIMAFRSDADARRTSLVAAAAHSAEHARSKIGTAAILLDTVSPETAGVQCGPRLSRLLGRVRGYDNLIRFDAAGHISCAAGSVRRDPSRAGWFQRLRAGEQLVVSSAPAGVYSPEPALIAAVRTYSPGGSFDGALAAVITIDSLRPDLGSFDLPDGAEAAVVDASGRYLVSSDPQAFGKALPPVAGGPDFYRDRDGAGRRRVFATAPLLGQDVRVLLSAPSPGLFSWARINPLSTVLLPFVAFLAALLAVWVVADQVVVRWLHYLQRIAAIYARGRFSVRARQVDRAPPEIRDLGQSLDAMAETIIARDQTLLQNLAQKDGLMREIHHRVKNNLQVISSLLNMQQRALTDPAARAAISDTRQRISAIALIYRALYQGPDLKKVDLKPFLEELTAQLLASEGPHPSGVRTELEADELIVDPDKLAPVALFAVEAISNAQKHALAHGAGLMRVKFTLVDEEACLEISDEGASDPPVLVQEGVGRTLMTAFARQLRGRTEVFDNGRGGVTSRLVFPAPEAAAKADGPEPDDKNGAAAA